MHDVLLCMMHPHTSLLILDGRKFTPPVCVSSRRRWWTRTRRGSAEALMSGGDQASCVGRAAFHPVAARQVAGAGTLHSFYICDMKSARNKTACTPAPALAYTQVNDASKHMQEHALCSGSEMNSTHANILLYSLSTFQSKDKFSCCLKSS